MEVLEKEETLRLIRSSAKSNEEVPGPVDDFKEAPRHECHGHEGHGHEGPKRKTKSRLKPIRGERSRFAKEQAPHDLVVDYVNAERKAAGLPTDVREEIAKMEEKFVRLDHKKGATIVSPLDSYLDTQTFTRKIVTANWAERVAKELVLWVNSKTDAVKVHEFFREKGIYHRDFYRVAKQYEILEQALDYAMHALGDIRERNILENKWNATVGMYMMGHYDEDWRKETERREAAKVKQAAASGIDIKAIIADLISPVAPTEEVREKLEEDKKRLESRDA